jgi:hypothetical protein
VKIVRTVREESCVFKLEEPVAEIFKRMRKVQKKVLDDMVAHPHYLTVGIHFHFKFSQNFWPVRGHISTVNRLSPEMAQDHP